MLVCENWLGALPVIVMLVTGNAALPLFVTVIAWDALGVFNGTFPSDTVAGDTPKGTLPVPFTVAVCVVPDPVTLSAAQE